MDVPSGKQGMELGVCGKAHFREEEMHPLLDAHTPPLRAWHKPLSTSRAQLEITHKGPLLSQRDDRDTQPSGASMWVTRLPPLLPLFPLSAAKTGTKQCVIRLMS